MKTQHLSGIALALALLAAPQLASAQSQPEKKAEESDPATWRLTTGLNYSTGDYGDTQDTEVVSAPVGIKYSKGNFSVKLSVPWVHISGPGSLLDTPQGRDASGGGSDSSGGSDNSGSGSSNSGSGSSGSGSSGGHSGSGSGGSGSSGGGSDVIGGGATTPAASSRSGLGDVSVTMAYSLDLGSDFYADVAGRVKLPTASKAKRIGTGKADVTASLDLGKDIGDLSLYVGGRRKFLGKPTGSALRNVWGAGGGASYRVSRAVTFGADYDWQQSAFAGNGPSSEVTGWTSFRLSPTLRMQVFGSTGFTTNSADFSGGLSISWRFH